MPQLKLRSTKTEESESSKKQLEGTRTLKTWKKPTDFLEERKPEQKPVEIDEGKIVTKVIGRFEKMRSKRTMIDRYWQMYQLQFEANYLPYQDGRSRSNVPLEWAIIELFVAEAIAKKSMPTITAIGETDVSKVEVVKRVWDVDRVQYDRDDELYRAEYITAIFGTCPYFNWVETRSRIIRDPQFKDGVLIGIPKLLEESKIVLKALDIRNVYIDDRVIDSRDAHDCIYKEYVTWEDIEQLKWQDGWQNLDTLFGWPKMDQAFWTKEDRAMMQEWQIELLHFWDDNTDSYFVVGNRQHLIKDTFIPYAHKSLPITMRQYGHNPMSIYGRGLCEALMNFKSEINTLKEMIMDGIKRSNNSLFAIGSGLGFDWEEFGFNNTTIKFTGALTPENFQELRGQAPNQAIFSYLEQLIKEVAMYVGIDPAGIIGSSSGTAFETAVRQESSLKRVNVALTNRDMALKHVYRKHLQNLMQFYPVISAKELFEIDASGKAIRWEPKPKSILLENENYVNGEFVPMDGRFPFEVKPEYIRGQLDIEVSTNFNAPTLKQLQLERYKDFTATMLQLGQAAQIPWFTDIIPMDKFIEQMAYDFDIDMDAVAWQKDSIKNAKAQIIQQAQQMAGIGWEAAGWQPTIPEQATQQFNMGTAKNISWNELQWAGLRKKVGWIMIPTTPNIGNTSPALKSLVW